MGKLFGTDGVRGVANSELTVELAYKLGKAGAYILTKEKNSAPRIMVAMDTRLSGDMLEAALISGICSVGATAISLGVIPTPAVSVLVRKYECDAGVVISASHNPMEDNGIKFFNSKGYKLLDELEDEIEEIILNDKKFNALPAPTGTDVGVHEILNEALDDYIEFLCESVPAKFGGITVALDCANGASYKAAPLAMYELDTTAYVINNEPNGININDNCGSTHIQALIDLVMSSGADVGFAYDGDADRCLAVDEKGNIVDGDVLLSIAAKYLKDLGQLKQNTLVVTVMTNLGLFNMAKEEGIKTAVTKVGDRYVLEEMLEKGYNLGGEASGHIIFLDHNTTGDGILSSLQILSIMKATGKKMSELASIMEIMPQVLVGARVSNDKKNDYEKDSDIQEKIKQLEDKFNGEGRVIIRPSGTEPLVRIMIEGKNKDEMLLAAEDLAKLIEEKFK